MKFWFILNRRESKNVENNEYWEYHGEKYFEFDWIKCAGNRGKQRLYNWYLKLYNLIKLRTTIETIALRIFFFQRKSSILGKTQIPSIASIIMIKVKIGPRIWNIPS